MSGIQQLISTFFNWSYMKSVFPQLFTVGLLNTVELSAASIFLAVIIGMLLAMMLLSRRAYVRAPARVYVEVFRGLPVILTIYLIGLGLPIAGLHIFGRNSYPYAILALGLIDGAYEAEIFRSGIQSVDRGQMEAARSLGLSYMAAMRLVVVPQGVMRILPALTNQFVLLIKTSSLVYLLGLLASQRELFSIAQSATSANGNLSPLVAAGLVYLLLTIPVTYVVNWMDRRMRNAEIGAAPGKQAAAQSSIANLAEI
jgi:polar amino acid transport system permease protein